MTYSVSQPEIPFIAETLSAKDIPECVPLVAGAFMIRQELVAQWFEQRLASNPWQQELPGIGIGIRHMGKLIAFRALFGQPWWLNGMRVTLAFASNTAVDANYRGYGLATKLISESTQFALLTGSTTAGNITQKAYKKIGYFEIGGTDNAFFRTRISYLGSMQKRLGIKLGTYVGKIADIWLMLRDSKLTHRSKFALQEVFRCDREFDEMWERAKAG
jgi:GNAT superfamily N-acetyltransferase